MRESILDMIEETLASLDDESADCAEAIDALEADARKPHATQHPFPAATIDEELPKRPIVMPLLAPTPEMPRPSWADGVVPRRGRRRPH